MKVQVTKRPINKSTHTKKIKIAPGVKVFGRNTGLLPYIKNINYWISLSIVLGIIIRLVQYFHNRSLWTDEAMLALNVVNRTFAQLLKPLDYDQGAPFGFLAVSKLFTVLFGVNEFALRLFPLLTGIASIILFYYLARNYLKSTGVLIAVTLFSFSGVLYYYAAEFKPYSSDVFCAALLFVIFIKLKNTDPGLLSTFILSVSGAIVIWFSFPSIFILAGIGIYMLLNYLVKRDLKSFYKFSIACVIWLISFAVMYYITLRNLSYNNYMQDFWNGAFIPVPSLSFGFFSWVINTFFNTFGFDLIVESSGLAALLFLFGVLGFYKTDRTAFYIFILPILITIMASMFHKYPFQGRLILFLIPSLFLFIAAGTDIIKDLAINYKGIYIIVLILLLFPLFNNSLWDLHKPVEKEEIKRTLSYLKSNIQPEDQIYLYYGVIPAFNFYKNKFNLAHYSTIKGISSRNNWHVYMYDLDRLKGKDRVWVLFSHIYRRTNEQTFFLTYLKNIGTLKKSFKTTGAEVYLFSFQ